MTNTETKEPQMDLVTALPIAIADHREGQGHPADAPDHDMVQEMCHQLTPDEVNSWTADAELEITAEVIEAYGVVVSADPAELNAALAQLGIPPVDL
jgi:hypothetical protein